MNLAFAPLYSEKIYSPGLSVVSVSAKIVIVAFAWAVIVAFVWAVIVNSIYIAEVVIVVFISAAGGIEQ